MYQQKEKNYVSIVCYLSNNETLVEASLLALDEFYFSMFENYEFVLVDDASTDKTVDIVRNLKNKLHANIQLIHLAYKHNLELAMIAGQKLAIGDYVFEIDTLNFDYPLSNLGTLYKESLKGFDIVALSPEKKSTFSNRLFYGLLEKTSLLKMKLYTETARIISRRAINRVGIQNNNVNYRKTTYHYCGLPTKNIFYKPTKDVAYNGLNFSSKFNLAYEIIIRYSQIASTISIGFSMMFFVFSILMIGFVIGSYLIVRNIASGWTTSMMFLTISFSGLFLVLSMILKYLDMLLRDRTVNRNYIYDSIEQIKSEKE